MIAKRLEPRSWFGTAAGVIRGGIRVGKLSACLGCTDNEHSRANLSCRPTGGRWSDPSGRMGGPVSGVGVAASRMNQVSRKPWL